MSKLVALSLQLGSMITKPTAGKDRIMQEALDETGKEIEEIDRIFAEQKAIAEKIKDTKSISEIISLTNEYNEKDKITDAKIKLVQEINEKLRKLLKL